MSRVRAPSHGRRGQLRREIGELHGAGSQLCFGLADKREQIAASLLAAATNLGAHAAVIMVGRVAIALLGASTTRDSAGLERRAYDAEVGFSLAGHDPPSGLAHVGAVKVQPNAPHQLRHIRLAEASVGTGCTGGRTVEALVDAAQKQVSIKADRPRMPVDDFSNRHVVSPSCCDWLAITRPASGSATRSASRRAISAIPLAGR